MYNYCGEQFILQRGGKRFQHLMFFHGKFRVTPKIMIMNYWGGNILRFSLSAALQYLLHNQMLWCCYNECIKNHGICVAFLVWHISRGRKKFQAGILILLHMEMIRKVMLLLQQHHYDRIWMKKKCARNNTVWVNCYFFTAPYLGVTWLLTSYMCVCGAECWK